MQIVVDCYYEILQESWKEMTDSTGKIKVPSGFLLHIASITIGSARGILYTKTEGTILNNYIMPLINMSNAVKEDMIVTPE